jgi:hypothetical protein
VTIAEHGGWGSVRGNGDATGKAPMNSVDPQFEVFLVFIKESRGFDFTGYKRPSLMRRVNRRMVEVGVDDYTEYLDYLQVHPDEFTPLFNTILINVTGFFRDPDAWQHIRTEVLEPLVASKPAHGRYGSGAPDARRARRPTPRPSCWPRSWDPSSSAAGEDIRHQCGRRGSHAGPAGGVRRARYPRNPTGAGVTLFRGERQPVHVPQGPPPIGHLRP